MPNTNPPKSMLYVKQSIFPYFYVEAQCAQCAHIYIQAQSKYLDDNNKFYSKSLVFGYIKVQFRSIAFHHNPFMSREKNHTQKLKAEERDYSNDFDFHSDMLPFLQ